VSLKVFDPDMTLSLTNIGVLVLIVKIATASTIDWPTTASLMLALLAYNHKKILRNKERATEAEAENKLKEIEQQVQDLNKAFAVSTLFKK
jgi:hypothetical protein